MVNLWALCAALAVFADVGADAIIDTSGWIGAEYQPSKSANEDWLYHYSNYRPTISRELKLGRWVVGYGSGDMVY